MGFDWHPILRWSRQGVLRFLEQSGFDLHEVYTQYGSSRVSCAFCILSSRRELAAAAKCADNVEVELEARSIFSFQAGYWQLSRLVLLDKVPGESYFVAECHRRNPQLGLAGVISFSDPVPRSTRDGLLVPGHVGTLYQALSSRLIGRSAPRTLRLLPDGSVLSDRTLQKL